MHGVAVLSILFSDTGMYTYIVFLPVAARGGHRSFCSGHRFFHVRAAVVRAQYCPRECGRSHPAYFGNLRVSFAPVTCVGVLVALLYLTAACCVSTEHSPSYFGRSLVASVYLRLVLVLYQRRH